MASGYENSRDYGGPEPGWPTWIGVVVVVGLGLAGMAIAIVQAFIAVIG